jgi:hypothetical protein
VRQQPAADDRFGDSRPFLARRRRCEVAEPRKALELLGERSAGSDRCKIEVAERKRFVAMDELAGKQRVAAPAIALHMVAGNRH